MKAKAALVWAGLLLLTALGWGAAQETDFCVLQDVKVEQVSNGVRMRLLADGLIQLENAPPVPEVANDPQRVSFLLSNARGAAAQTVMVGKYPVSHLEFAVPTDAREGVGVICTVVLYRPAVLASLGTDGGGAPVAPGTVQVMVFKTPAQDELLVLATSDRPREERVPRPERPAPSVLRVSGAEGNLSLYAVNADAGQVMARLAAQTSVPILLDNAVGRRVSANLEGVSLHQLLTVLTNCYALTLSWERGQYVISSGMADTAAAYAASETRRIQLNYLSPSQAMTVLPEVMLPYVRVDTTGNAVFATGPGPILAKLEADLKGLDKPAHLCELKAWVVTAASGDDEVRQVMAEVAGEDTQVQGNSSGELSLAVGPQRAPAILVRLQALSRQRRLRVRSVASILVANGQRASLFRGEQVYYWRLTGRRRQRVFLDYLDVGNQLEFVPRTGGDAVTAYVSVKDSSLTGTNELGPLVALRRAETTVRINSGDTLVVGGLESSSLERQHDSGPPPWPLSAVLSGYEQRESAQDVWLLLQARVVEDGSPSQYLQSEAEE